MNSLNIKTIYNGINIECSFDNKLNILRGYSGTGKTLLLNAIDLYCLNNKIACRLCNYNVVGFKPNDIINVCEDAEIVLLDNADLYLNNDILKSILKTAKFVIISIKDTSDISLSGANEYIVEYKNVNLTTRKL